MLTKILGTDFVKSVGFRGIFGPNLIYLETLPSLRRGEIGKRFDEHGQSKLVWPSFKEKMSHPEKIGHLATQFKLHQNSRMNLINNKKLKWAFTDATPHSYEGTN